MYFAGELYLSPPRVNKVMARVQLGSTRAVPKVAGERASERVLNPFDPFCRGEPGLYRSRVLWDAGLQDRQRSARIQGLVLDDTHGKTGRLQLVVSQSFRVSTAQFYPL